MLPNPQRVRSSLVDKTSKHNALPHHVAKGARDDAYAAGESEVDGPCFIDLPISHT